MSGQRPVPVMAGGHVVMAHPVVVDVHCALCGARARLPAGACGPWGRPHLRPHVDDVVTMEQCTGPGCTRC